MRKNRIKNRPIRADSLSELNLPNSAEPSLSFRPSRSSSLLILPIRRHTTHRRSPPAALPLPVAGHAVLPRPPFDRPTSDHRPLIRPVLPPPEPSNQRPPFLSQPPGMPSDRSPLWIDLAVKSLEGDTRRMIEPMPVQHTLPQEWQVEGWRVWFHNLLILKFILYFSLDHAIDVNFCLSMNLNYVGKS